MPVANKQAKEVALMWEKIHQEVVTFSKQEPFLLSFFQDMVIQHKSFAESLTYLLAKKVCNDYLSCSQLASLFLETLRNEPKIQWLIAKDIEAFVSRDPAVNDFSTPLLYFKGLHALSVHRISHHLWNNKQPSTALFLQNRVSDVFAVDIHPAAVIGHGILIDHGTGLVIGETASVGNNVSILHEVTLGGNGKERGDRHPKIGNGVLIGAGAKVLGNVSVGCNAKIGAGSVVLTDVEMKTTVAGVPAKYVGENAENHPALEMMHLF